jgi:CheY-like chemotaxis protein
MHPTEASLDRQRILLIEDHEDCARSLRVLLELLGYQVEVARSGSEGVRLALALRPNVILSDINLPGLDGWNVAAELRRHPATAAANLIAITAFGTERDKRRSYQAGFDHHLTKPVDLSLLLKLLRRPSPSPARPWSERQMPARILAEANQARQNDNDGNREQRTSHFANTELR